MLCINKVVSDVLQSNMYFVEEDIPRGTHIAAAGVFVFIDINADILYHKIIKARYVVLL